MAANALTPEQMTKITRYIDGEKDAEIDDETLALFDALHYKLHRKIYENLSREQKKSRRLETKAERLEDKLKAADAADAEGFTEAGLDSADVAACLAAETRNVTQKGISRSRMLTLTYMAYVSWLGNKKQRLFLEHPVATQYGPIFWRAYKKVNPETEADEDAFRRVADQNPGAAAFLRNVAKKYHDADERMMANFIKNSAPYKNALPKEGEKWCKTIQDDDIYAWAVAIHKKWTRGADADNHPETDTDERSKRSATPV
jgi:uncharacterized phage-associated protein